MQGSMKQQERSKGRRGFVLGGRTLIPRASVWVVGCDVIRSRRFIDSPPLLLRE